MDNWTLEEARAELAPAGALRAGINTGNFLLVTGRTTDGDPDGVAPDIARAIAARLGVPLQMVSFPSAGALGDAATADVWDIGLLGAEPQRAETIEFTSAYAQIEATYLIRAGTAIQTMADVDAAGVRIVAPRGSAYSLWLERNIRHATLLAAEGIPAAFDRFLADGLEALAGLRPGLLEDVRRVPGGAVLDGHFATVQQAVGTRKTSVIGARFLRAFVEEAKASGLIAGLIAKHGVEGRLSLAPPV